MIFLVGVFRAQHSREIHCNDERIYKDTTCVRPHCELKQLSWLAYFLTQQYAQALLRCALDRGKEMERERSKQRFELHFKDH